MVRFQNNIFMKISKNILEEKSMKLQLASKFDFLSKEIYVFLILSTLLLAYAMDHLLYYVS